MKTHKDGLLMIIKERKIEISQAEKRIKVYEAMLENQETKSDGEYYIEVVNEFLDVLRLDLEDAQIMLKEKDDE